MKVTDNFYGSDPNYENRKLFAQLLNPYDIYSEFASGYKDGVREIEESIKSIEDIKSYIDTFIEISKDEYEIGYRQAFKDYIKQEEMKEVTNESI